MESMQALYFEQTGEAKAVLTLGSLAKPTPGKGEVLIKLLGSPINPSDYYFIEGKYRIKPVFPQVAGLEGAGVVEAVGEGVQLATGALAAFLWPGAWAEYIVVPEAELLLLPSGFPPEKAIQFTLNPFTAYGLLETGKVKPGQWILVSGGNSALVRILVQLAHRRGVRTIVTVRQEGFEPELKSLGADAVLVFDEKELPGRVRALTEGRGVDVAFDAIGGATGSAFLQSLSLSGSMIIFGVVGKDPVQFMNAQFVYSTISLRGFGIRGWLAAQTADRMRSTTAELAAVMGDENFRLGVEAFAPGSFAEALDAAQARGRREKVVLRFG